MRFNFLIFSILFFSVFKSNAQKNYIIPEPKKIEFIDNNKVGFRLFKKSSLELIGVSKDDQAVKDLTSFIGELTGFSLSEKVNKKSNILIKVSSGIENIGEEGYLISILPKQYLTIEANSKKGVYYGVQTLKQILLYTKEKRDNPNFVSFEKNEKIVEENYDNVEGNFNAANLTTKGYKSIQDPGDFVRNNKSDNARGDFTDLPSAERLTIDAYEIPSIVIEDSPRFQYRGMMLDVSRHFMPVPFIKKFIDIIAMHKMNTFHWHLTDDQGWRIEIKRYPKLTEVGSKRKETLVGHSYETPISLGIMKKNPKFDGIPHEGYYSQEEIKGIISYASERYVTIIPEIDIPGHTSSMIAAYPELGSSKENIGVKTLWGVQNDILNINENTFEFLENMFSEIIDLFPSKYIHIGGDEARKDQWKNSNTIQNQMKDLGLKDENELQSYFIKRVEKFINSKGKKIIGWDEIIDGGLAPNATVMSWRGEEGAIHAAKSGHEAIMSPTSHCYFDYYQDKPINEPLAIGGLIPLKKVYLYEPIPQGLSNEESKKILGAQGNLWTEYIKEPKDVEYMIIPRMTALSEIVWSPRKLRNLDEFKKRLKSFKFFYDNLNINYRKNDFQ